MLPPIPTATPGTTESVKLAHTETTSTPTEFVKLLPINATPGIMLMDCVLAAMQDMT